jgi:chemotaxis signal transduction protein
VVLENKLRARHRAPSHAREPRANHGLDSLLDVRAARYARTSSEPPAIERTVVAFRRHDSSYGVTLEELREIRALARWCRLPGTSSVVPGVVHYRGELLTLLDLAALSAGACEGAEASWMLVIEQAGERIGLMADDVTDVLALEAGCIHALPLTMGSAGDTFVGMSVDGLLIVDTTRLMAVALQASG